MALYLRSSRALQYVHKSAGHLLFVLHADDGLQHRAQHGIVIGHKLCKLFVLLHGQDGDSLEARFDADGGASTFGFAGGGGANRIPFLHKLPSHHSLNWYVHQTHIVVFVLLFFLVSITVDVYGDALNGRHTGELKVFPPEQAVRAGFAGGAGVQHVIQTQLTEILLFRWQIFGFDDPQTEDVFRPSAVVLVIEPTVSIKQACMLLY